MDSTALRHIRPPISFRNLCIAWFMAFSTVAIADNRQFLLQTPGANHPADIDDWRKQDTLGDLKPYPAAQPAGQSLALWWPRRLVVLRASLGMPFVEFRQKMARQRRSVDNAAREALNGRFDLTCRHQAGVTMSRTKP